MSTFSFGKGAHPNSCNYY